MSSLPLLYQSWFKHILFRRKGLGVAYNATMPSPVEVFTKEPNHTHTLPRIGCLTTLPLNACMFFAFLSAPVYIIPEVQPSRTVRTAHVSHLHSCNIHHVGYRTLHCKGENVKYAVFVINGFC